MDDVPEDVEAREVETMAPAAPDVWDLCAGSSCDRGSSSDSTSSSGGSSSSSSSSSGDDDDDDDDKAAPIKALPLEEVSLKPPNPAHFLRTKNELRSDLLPIVVPNVAVGPQDKFIELGKVRSVIDSIVVVTSVTNSALVDLDTPVCLQDKSTVIGVVEEVMGPVKSPFYSLRVPPEHLSKMVVGSPLFYVYRLASFAVPSFGKGSDASNVFDEEVPEHLRDFSDDEEEQAFKKARKSSRRKKRDRPQHELSEERPPQVPRMTAPAPNAHSLDEPGQNVTPEVQAALWRENFAKFKSGN